MNSRVATFRLVLVLTILAVLGVAWTGLKADASVVEVAAVQSSVAPAGEPAAAESVTAEPVAAELPAEAALFDAESWTPGELGAVDPKIFALALSAASTAVNRGDVEAPSTLTVIDFSRPSTTKRMWVYDLKSRELLFEELVSHGRGSGKTLATAFSNVPESNQSSIGLYRAAETYVGKHGYSLRLDGLDRGFNDRARERAIVMHAADYVNEAAAKAQGYLGRSLGCPALRPEITRDVIDTVKDGGLIFAYYPDATWLESSAYLP